MKRALFHGVPVRSFAKTTGRRRRWASHRTAVDTGKPAAASRFARWPPCTEWGQRLIAGYGRLAAAAAGKPAAYGAMGLSHF